MAVLALQSIQVAATRGDPRSTHSKLRMDYFEAPAITVAGDINTTMDLCYLPPGNVRVLPSQSYVAVSAWGAARTLNVGHRAYSNEDMSVQIAENASAFGTGIDVSAAAIKPISATVLKYDMYSKAGIKVFLTVLGGTIPVGATLKGLLAYLYE